MITNIEVDGFKSLEAVHLDIKPITVLIGLNSSGKSSILQMFQILKQTVQNRNYQLSVSGPLANLGSFREILSKKKGKKVLSMGIGGIRNQNLPFPFSRNTEYRYDFTVNENGIKSYSATQKSGTFILDTISKSRREVKKISINFGDKPHNMIEFHQEFIIGNPFRYSGQFGLPDDFDYDIINKRFLKVIAKDLEDFRLVPAIRGVTCPQYPLADSSSDDLVDSTNPYSQAQKLSSTVVYNSTSIERKVNRWIERITGVKIKARTVPNKQASIEVSKNYSVNLVNEGFGTNQLVHMFAQIANSPDNSLIGIEEPEVHLHPKAQSELAKVLIEIVKEEMKKLILTTHSEHILYRILIEVAKGTLKLEDLAIYHFRLSKDGVTQIERLKPDEKGRLKGGIPDFLETDLDEFKDFLEVLKG